MENNVIISIQGKQSFEDRSETSLSWSPRGGLEPDGDDAIP